MRDETVQKINAAARWTRTIAAVLLAGMIIFFVIAMWLAVRKMEKASGWTEKPKQPGRVLQML